MKKGCKIWLWFLMIGNGFSILLGLSAISYSGFAGGFAILAALVQMLGIGLMLFKQKKEGFYVQCGVVIVGTLVNIINGINIIFALVSAIASPAITYYLIFKKNGLGIGTISAVPAQTTVYNSTSTQSTHNENPVEKEQNSSENKKDGYAPEGTLEDNINNTSGKNIDANDRKNTANAETDNTFNGKTIFSSGKNMDVTVDLYKELEIDRAWDEKSIRNHLKGLQKLWTQRQGATNDKEQLLLIDKILKHIEYGYRYLTKALKRKQYDQALEIAYKAGKIIDEAEEKLNNILDQAREYYRKGKIQLAAKFAQEAVDGKVNDPSAYELLARCYFDVNSYEKAVNIIDQGLSIFDDNVNLHWLGARMATIGTKNYEDAQRRVNALIALNPEISIGHSEQVHLHLRSGNESLAFEEIDSYIAAHPDDDGFKRGVAYDLDAYSNTCYYYDAAQNASFIADKESYNKCLMLRSKATEIFDDEHTQNLLESAKFYGKKEWNDWNMESIKSLALYGSIFVGLDILVKSGLFFGIGFCLYTVMGILIYFSFRPYWQINKTYVTGEMGTVEKIINRVGEQSAKIAVLMLQALWKMVELIIKFGIAIASGKWF